MIIALKLSKKLKVLDSLKEFFTVFGFFFMIFAIGLFISILYEINGIEPTPLKNILFNYIIFIASIPMIILSFIFRYIANKIYKKNEIFFLEFYIEEAKKKIKEFEEKIIALNNN